LVRFKKVAMTGRLKMYRLFVGSAVLSILAGCASNVPEPALQARNDPAQAAPVTAAVAAPAPVLSSGAPVAVDVEDFKNRTFCKNVVKPGTRIVVGKQCNSSESDRRHAREQEATRAQTEASLHQQDQITRAARERDLDYQRPVLMRTR
jgi:hypothetical protein